MTNTQIAPGWYEIPNKKYQAIKAVSRSSLHKILRSPAHMRVPQKETPALFFGTAFHTAILEPEKFKENYVVMPEGLKSNGALMPRMKDQFGADACEALKNKGKRILSSGRTILKADEMSDLNGMAEAVRSHPVAWYLLSNGRAEVSGFWQDPIYPEIQGKIRVDWLNISERALIDVKSTVDARKHAFTASAYKNGYHMQAGWYVYGAAQITQIEHSFWFIAVEKEPPFGVMVYRADEGFIQEGMKDCQKALKIFHDCETTNQWDAYPPEVQSLGLPAWVLKDENHQPIIDGILPLTEE